ncbi:11099_t:CDS:1, partial [Paraglomus occultum]
MNQMTSAIVIQEPGYFPKLNNEDLGILMLNQLRHLSELLFPLFVSPHTTHERFFYLRELWYFFNRNPCRLLTENEFFRKLEALSRAETESTREEGWSYVMASLIIDAQSPRHYPDGVSASNSNVPSPDEAMTSSPEYSPQSDKYQKIPSQSKKSSRQHRSRSGVALRKPTRQQPYNGGGFIVMRPVGQSNELTPFMTVFSKWDLPDNSDPNIFSGLGRVGRSERTTNSQSNVNDVYQAYVYPSPQASPNVPIIPSQPPSPQTSDLSQ